MKSHQRSAHFIRLGIACLFVMTALLPAQQEPPAKAVQTSTENPYWRMAERTVSDILKSDEPKLLEEGNGGAAFWLAWAYTSPKSKFKGRPEIREKVIQIWDGTASRLKASKEPWTTKDGNFWNLMSLLDSLLFIEGSKEFPTDKVTSWKEALRPAVEESWREYGHKTDKSWATKAAKEYPNADAQHAAVMMAASLVYGEEKYRQNAAEFVQAMDQYLKPPGAWLYFKGSSPIPLYHGFELIFLGRYYQLSRDPLAADQIRRTKDYYPYTFTPENTVEGTSTPSWKYGWNPSGGPYHAVEFVAWLAGDGHNRWLADLRAKQYARHYWIAYCGEAWDEAGDQKAKPEPFPDRFIIPDDSIDGLRGRFGKFSFMGGRGKRITGFGSCMLADAALPSGYDGFVHFARLGIAPQGDATTELRLVGEDKDGPVPGARVVTDEYAVLAAEFEPRLPSDVEAPARNDWSVKERWLFTPNAVVALFEAVAQKDDPGGLPIGRIELGPNSREALLNGKSFQIGNLHGKVLLSDGFTLHSESVPPEPKNKFYAIVLKPESAPGKIQKGDTWKYAVVFSPEADISAEARFQENGDAIVKLGASEYVLGPLKDGKIEVVKK